ncbi:MAG: hypothetical protein R6U85_03865 [Salinivirgaceae bacterium]
MRYLKTFILALFFLLFIGGCRPQMMVEVDEPDDSDLPRYCFTERMFFYELENADENIVLNLHTNQANTRSQLLKMPIFVFIANKTKRDVRYRLEYRENFIGDSLLATHSQPTIKLFSITDKQETTITDKYQFGATAEITDLSYNLRLQFPKALLKELEEPVMGIVSELPKEDRKSASSPSTTSTRATYQQNQMYTRNTRTGYSPAQEQINSPTTHTIPTIDVWFRVKL